MPTLKLLRSSGSSYKYRQSSGGGPFALEYLIVGGGGGGGADVGGGGGGSQVVYNTATVQPGLTYTITVGGGGSRGGTYQFGYKGSNSTLNFNSTTYTAVGGSGGAGRTNGGGYSGGTGYNGGGASYDQPATPYSGGYAGYSTGGGTSGSGGGGAGAGAAATSANGGNGVQYSSMAVNSGSSGYYGGGGAGGPYPSGSSTGGLGGGANGSASSDGVDGVSSTGGGGSGGRSVAAANGSNGGSGVVVLKFPSNYTLSGGSGLGYTLNTSSPGYKIYTFTSGTGNISISSVSNGSIFFDGSGDYIYTTNTSSNYSYGTGNFTIEFWVRPTAGPAGTYNPTFFTNHGDGDWAATGGGIRIHHQNVIFGSGSPTVITYSSAIQNNVWTHLAITREGSTLRAFHNGQIVGSTTYGSSLGDSTDRPALATSDSITSGGREFLTGYISNLRIVKGTALYTSNFTPPTSALTAVSGTVLLLNTSSSGTFSNDSSSYNAGITVAGGASWSSLNPFS
jgi:hypothetical protein